MAAYPSLITPEHSPGPNASAISKWLRTIFGNPFSITRGYSSGHDGLDLGAKEGTPVYAIKSGIVSYARDARTQADHGLGNWAAGGGNVVNIDVGGHLTTQYAHLKDFNVREGQLVQAGQLIGHVGRTGGTTSTGAFGGPGAQFVGSHLHFGLWDKSVNKMINPQSFLQNIGDTSGGPSTGQNLGAWGDLVNYPVGHVLTAADVDSIMQILGANGFFQGDSLFGGSQTEIRRILTTHIGDSWGKPLQDQLQAEFGAAAVNSTDPIGRALGGVGTQIADTITWIGFILLGIVFIFGGIYLLRPTEGTA